MLKGDMEIHFLDRTVDHPITVRKLIPSTSLCGKQKLPAMVKDINVLYFKLQTEYMFCMKMFHYWVTFNKIGGFDFMTLIKTTT